LQLGPSSLPDGMWLSLFARGRLSPYVVSGVVRTLPGGCSVHLFVSWFFCLLAPSRSGCFHLGPVDSSPLFWGFVFSFLFNLGEVFTVRGHSFKSNARGCQAKSASLKVNPLFHPHKSTSSKILLKSTILNKWKPIN
jgi:hypothetical protein